MPNHRSLSLVGYASGIGGAEAGSVDAPSVMQQSPYLAALAGQGLQLEWSTIVNTPTEKNASKLSLVTQQCTQLAQAVASLVQQKKFFTVIGGDHTSAIGTWSGVSSVAPDFGLIWVDAHMDSHTPETTQSGNLHGMPLASLLGQGENSLVKLMGHAPKIKPQNVCLIGIRSYEQGEVDLLNRLNVRVFYMDEVKQRGLSTVFAEAIQIVTKNTANYGITIDIDSMDPNDAPGTGVAEPGGIAANDLYQALTTVAQDTRLLGAEIVEFDPHRDHNQLTEKLIARLIAAMMLGSH